MDGHLKKMKKKTPPTYKDSDMKKNISHIASLLLLALTIASCEKREPDLFDEGANGAYFDYEYASDFSHTLNFADHIVGVPDTVSVTLKVRLLGYLHDEARSLAIKTREVEGYPLAHVTIGDVVFANREYEKTIEVKVERPEVEDTVYAVCIYLDGSGDIGTGIEGKDKFNLYVTEQYGKPSVWFSHMEDYLGAWSKAKHLFLAGHTSNNTFYANLYDSELGMHLFDSIIALNVSAVNALLASEPKGAIEVDLPILRESDYPAYVEPYFWHLYEDYLGTFRANKFCRFTTMLGGSNTRDIAALYASQTGMDKMVEEAEGFHKSDVLEMLHEYYNYAQSGLPITEYKALCWVEMKNSVNYTMRIPYWWEDPHGLGTADIVKRYFGEYEAEKYQFMLKTVMKDDGEPNFIAASLLPFVYLPEQGTYAWDHSPFGTKQLAGEERLKECYRLIKAANDKRPSAKRFDIPDVSLD